MTLTKEDKTRLARLLSNRDLLIPDHDLGAQALVLGSVYAILNKIEITEILEFYEELDPSINAEAYGNAGTYSGRLMRGMKALESFNGLERELGLGTILSSN